MSLGGWEALSSQRVAGSDPKWDFNGLMSRLFI